MRHNVKWELEHIEEMLDDLRRDVEPMSQSDLGELDKRVLVITLKDAANSAERVLHWLKQLQLAKLLVGRASPYKEKCYKN